MRNIITTCLLMVSFFAFAQQKTIKGKIVDKKGVPLLGVNVIQKGTKNGTNSNFDGEYSITLKGKGNKLEFSFLGYKTITVIADKAVVNVQLEESALSLDEITVTVGLRAAQLQAIKDKRNSDDIIESITSEDIGSFSDNNTADALERVAGVQVERNIDGTGGDRISIQGLGPEFVEVTINGRTPLSAGDDGYSGLRQFNLDVLPTEIISGATINKTGGAGSSGGIGGNVNFNTMRPLNMRYKGGKKYFGVVSSRTTANSDKPELGSRNSMAFGGKITDKLGAFVTYLQSNEVTVQNSYGLGIQTPRDYRIDINGNGVYDEGVDTFYAAIDSTHFGPANGGATINKRINKRAASSFGIQYKPNKKLDIMLDYTYTSLEIDSQRDVLQTFFNGFYGDNTLWSPDALEFNGSHLTYFDIDGAVDAGYFIRSRTTQTKNTTKSGLGGLNVRYNANKKLNLAADLSYSTINFVGQTVNAGTIIYNQAFDEFNPQDLSLDVRGDKPSFGYPNIYDPNIFDGGVPNVGNAKTKNIGIKYQAKLTADYRLNKNFRLNAGVTYDYSDTQSRRFIVNSNTFVKENGTIGLTAEQLQTYIDFVDQGDRTDGVFLEGGTGLDNWLASSGFALFNADPEFASYNGGEVFNFDKHLSEIPGEEDNVGFTPSRSYQIIESNLKAYLDVRWITKIFGRKSVFRFSSSVVKYDNASSGFSSITFYDPLDDTETADTGFSQYLVTDNTTINFLPSFNGTVDLTKKLKFRLAASKRLSRPRVRSLLPNNTIRLIDPESELLDPNSENYSPNDPNFRNTITAGNAALVPRTAWSFNTALSYYTNNGGIFTVGGFYRDIRNNSSILRLLDQPFPSVDEIGIVAPEGFEDTLVDIRQPVNNASNAQVYGFEAGFNQHFTFLPGFLSGFGFSANFTYTESEFVTNQGIDSPLGLPGTSKYSGKAILYYQKYDFTFRATGSYRSNYLSRLGSFGNIGQDITQYTIGNAVFGLNAQYNLGKQININMSVSNLTGADNQKYLDNDVNNFLNFTALQPVYTLGVLYRL
ncbi:TonB-dependent receptor [Polaribacter vadi]|uniref:TonB-dependent receptor n=1 Tax=Polaribacter TaxID=52959 RepID=UPI001C0A4E8F|nr:MULTISPECIES: TonB-dependent receptor [Polaribacter]MBU3011368.1 TonB-dependent receptor [Polaribacter vadi]MDO6741180.1 TonB-dependent receptor [Polaribacter sp. 1_MG-2023]